MSQQRHTLAFEIGVEEMPARFIPEAIDAMGKLAAQHLEDLRLADYERLEVLSTPRRLVLMVYGLPGRQEDGETWVRGPGQKTAYDEEGQPTQAALGFARGQGVAPEDLVTKETEQGPYVFARLAEPGQPAADVLAEPLAKLITQLPFPRPMRWGEGDFRFIRPIRWLVALLDDEVLPVSVGGVTAGRQTYGHRTLARGPHEIATAADLPPLLPQIGAEADVQARQDKIRQQAQEVAVSLGGEAVVDADLLTEVTHLVEKPTAFAGNFEPGHLSLPPELLITVMKVHQRYFPVAQPGTVDSGEAPQLMPHFIGVCNDDDRNLPTVQKGNEKVIAARLADARFFYEQDQEQTLADLVPQLANVGFREKLGTMLDKTKRLESLVDELCTQLDVDETGRQRARRAATLTRADLMTQVVNEFSELEGTMGRHYARLNGEEDEVAEALYEQYLPAPGSSGEGTELPTTMAGTLLGIADRVDTLTGSFAIGLEPTGSQDPFGLRRQAAGLLVLLAQRQVSLPLDELLAQGLAGYGTIEGADDDEAVLARLLEFCRVRLAGQLRDAGYRADVIESVLARSWTNLPDTWRRVEAITNLLAADYFDDVATVFRRAHNLARQAEGAEVDHGQLREEPELALHDALTTVAPEAEAARAGGNYDDFFRITARLRTTLDGFLDGVLVMAPEPEIRANRLALLAQVNNLLGSVADLSRLTG